MDFMKILDTAPFIVMVRKIEDKKRCKKVIGLLYTKYYRSSQSSSYTGLRCAVSVKYTVSLQDLVPKMIKGLLH